MKSSKKLKKEKMEKMGISEFILKVDLLIAEFETKNEVVVTEIDIELKDVSALGCAEYIRDINVTTKSKK